ncbi:hypothetical protein CANARDRAFT_29878 [[Candida] arabinofermentans NRRL YB-2248]|uniref:RRM domain-containing protein n=1 Tax=[Candida] arabinofermentans NRRL YB-2248 TaxID=983967 RepID=A0A1E4SW54_9ASCO|nr:hypothetical protein CANARDRAFT_29878 [[Candida] arabinofermentans NRRL YB-2248]
MVKSIGGYILIVTNLHEETTEDAVLDVFEEYGKITNIHLNLDSQTGYVQGYALLEFQDLDEAESVIRDKGVLEVLGNPVDVDYAFVVASETFNRRAKSHRDRSPIR